ncbi:MAG: PAS domain S-box protein [Candidatus Thermoplasmatota archaeon]
MAGLEAVPSDDMYPDSVDEDILLGTLLDSIPDTIYFKDLHSRFIKVNNSQAEFLGVDHPEEVVGKTDFDFFTEEHAKSAYQDEQKIIETGEPVVGKIEKVRRHDGEFRWMSSTKIPLTDKDDNIIGIAGISRDITDRIEAKEKYERLINSSPDIIAEFDQNGEILTANQAMAEELAYDTPKEVVGRNAEEFLKEEVFEKALKISKEAIKNDEIKTMEEKRGKGRYFHDIFVPLKTGSKKTIQVISRDITEFKETQHALAESEKKFRGIAERSFDIIFSLDLKGNITYASPAVERITGYNSEEILGKNFKDLIPEKHTSKVIDVLERLKKGKTVEGFNIEVQRKDNSLATVEINASPITRNGEIVGIQGAGRDITNIKRVRDEIKVKDKAIDSSINAIAIADMKGNVTYVNQSFLDMWGYEDNEEVIGEPIVKFWETKGKFVEVMDALIEEGGWVGELKAEKKNRDTFHAQLSATTVRDEEDEPICMMASFVDITEQKKAEQKIRESERAKTEFMNIAAHELKTPIIPIKGYLEMILWDKEIDEEKRKWIKICLRNTNTLIYLVNDILDVSRLESNTMNLVKEEGNIEDTVTGVVQDMYPLADEKNIDIDARIPDDLPSLNFDKQRISQVLRNLINNAIKFTSENGDIQVGVAEQENKIKVSVNDNGKGIKKQDLPKLFKKFSQLDKGETRKTTGTGLGLYICKGIIEKHDGEIWAESTPGEGSTFSFTLPKK